MDTAGNVNATLVTAVATTAADTTDPDTTIVSNPPSVSNSSSATFTFTSTESGTFECQLDTSVYLVCTTPKVYTDLTDGSHTFYVRAIDGASNVDPTPANYAWTVDVVASDIVITIISPEEGNIVNSSRITWQVSGGISGAAFINISIDGSQKASLVRSGNETGSYEFSEISNSLHKVRIWLVDDNYIPLPYPETYDTVNFTIDTILPVTTITDPLQNSTIRFVYNIAKGEVIDANLKSAELIVMNETSTLVSRYNLTISNNRFTQRIEYAPNQNNTLRLIATDKAGNENSTSAKVSVGTNAIGVFFAIGLIIEMYLRMKKK